MSILHHAIAAGLALALAVGGVIACGHASRGPIHDASALDDSSEQLQGTWVLESFEPSLELEPMLAALLQAQLGTMVVKLDGKTLEAVGPGISIAREYEVVESSFGRIKVVVDAGDGTTYELFGILDDDTLKFRSLTSPWKGEGELRRQ